jgi:hypothetical protein
MEDECLSLAPTGIGAEVRCDRAENRHCGYTKGKHAHDVRQSIPGSTGTVAGHPIGGIVAGEAMKFG